MRAVICQDSELSVRDLPEPVPGEGQVLVRVLRCGICGSDLHMRHEFNHMHELMERVGYGDIFPTATDPIVFGHEFCCEVLDYGPGCERRLNPMAVGLHAARRCCLESSSQACACRWTASSPLSRSRRRSNCASSLVTRRSSTDDTVHLIAEGKVNCAPMITGTVGLDGVAGAFDALRDPERHAKILIDPVAATAGA